MVRLLALFLAIFLFVICGVIVVKEQWRVRDTNAMHEAVYRRDTARLVKLLDSGKPIDQLNEEKVFGIRIRSLPLKYENGVTPLYVAVCQSDPAIVKLLIGRGAKVNYPVHSPYTILGRALTKLLPSIDIHGTGMPEEPPDDVKMRIIQLLVDAGADVSERKYEGGESPIEMCERMELDDAKRLLETKAAPSSPQTQTSN
jgi:ankyrin repeat protein